MPPSSHKIAIKRAYDPPVASDGVRILVDRLWPRGLRKDAAHFDQWRKDLSPSTELRQFYGHRPNASPNSRRVTSPSFETRKRLPQSLTLSISTGVARSHSLRRRVT